MMMPYASSSSATLSQGYDVFLSFRGEDTRMNFTSHLYDALTRHGVATYKDDRSLEIGSVIAPKLLEAIEASRFAVVVLSSKFATSKWCLDEILKIVDCMKRGKLTIIPVFYHVSPSEVRHQSNCFEQAFTNHEVDQNIAPQKVETWRDAFAKVGNISGLHLTKHSNEVEIIKEIVSKILKDTQDTLPIDLPNRLVGIESRVDEVKGILRMDSYEVLFIGICGMSGIGKTTLAETVYKDVKDKFQKCIFLESIKDISKQNDSSDLRNLQQKLLDEILHERSIPVQTVNHGQTLLGSKLRGFKVIIVLDDVNHLDQLIYLAGSREWFGPGSRIIITTTDADLLNQHDINEIHMCEEMKGDEALRLFCQSAFKKEHPTHGYEKLSDDIVNIAGGLPLALNVYGSMLYRKEESYWKDMLTKLGKYPPKEVLGRLEVVYTRLDRHQQKTFIYIACFLKGRNKDLVQHILNNIGLEGGFADLKNKRLIAINLEDSVWMHDLLQKMCWEILNKESRKYVGVHIAIKYHQDVVKLLSTDSKETQIVEIINYEPYNAEMDHCLINPTCFSNMPNLKFLRISNVHCNKGRLNYLSNDLRILEWYECPLKSFPSTFQPTQIYELEMCNSQLKLLWEKDQVLDNLRSFNLSFSKNLTKIPDLTSASNLEKLNLEGCTNLKELHKSVLLLKRVRYMNLKGCTRLRSLGRSNMEMEALEALILSGCSNLKDIPEFGQNMKRLEHLYVDGTSIKKLPDNLGEMCDLRKLDVSGTSIEELPSFIHYLRKLRLLRVTRCRLSFKTRGFLYPNMDTLSSGLRDLDLSYCNMAIVPDGICLLQRLVNLDLSGNDFVSLPTSISLLSNLKMLFLNDCKRLKSLPKLSIVNDEYTLYGLHIRFKYYISREGVDLSKYHATNDDSSPTVLCLNCPKLVEDKFRSSLAEKILESYLNLRGDDWNTPEAVFEVVGAGKVIPRWFSLLGSDDLIVDGPWTRVAICAVVSVHHVDAYLEESKYVVTAHINVGEKHRKIPVPINFLVPGLENQLVFYWTAADDDLVPRTVGWNEKHNCRFSFTVEPGNDNVQVTNFRVRIIRDKDEKIEKLEQLKFFGNMSLYWVFKDSLSLPNDLLHLLPSAVDTELHNLYSSFKDDLTNSIKTFIIVNTEQPNSLDSIHKLIKCLHEVNQEVLSACKEEWRQTHLYPLVYDYYRISHGISEFCNDFVRLLKDLCDSWVSVKLALKQIVVNGRANGYTCKDMQQLDDLEAAEGVGLSDTFVLSFARICKKIAVFSTHLVGVMQGHMGFKSLKVFMKVSRLTVAGIFSIVATFMHDSELLRDMEDTTSHDIWLDMIFGNERSSEREWHVKFSFDRELQIWDFKDNAVLLQELKNKITSPNYATRGIEEEMMIVIDKLEKNIDKISKTVEDMGSHAYQYSYGIREAGITYNQFITDGKLQLSKLGISFKSDEDILQLKRLKDPMREAVINLFRATAFLPPALHSYIRVFRVEKKTCRIIKSNIKSVLHTEQGPFCDFLEIIRCLYVRLYRERYLFNEIGGHKKWLDARFLLKKDNVRIGLLNLLIGFRILLTGVFESWDSVMLLLEKILLKTRAGEYTYQEMLQQLNDVKDVESIGFSQDFVTSFEYICDEISAFIRIMNSIIYTKKLEAPSFLRRFSLRIRRNKKKKLMKEMKHYGKLPCLAIYFVLSFMATCMGDFELLQEMENMSSNSTLLHLIQCFSRKSGKWFDEKGCIKKTSYDGELRIWDCYGNTVLLQELKNKMATFSCFTIEAEEEMVIVIHKLKKKLNDLSDAFSKLNREQ